MAGRFRLEAVYAGKGDCLILHHGTDAKPKWMLIDGGHWGVYDNFLRPRLEQLRAENTKHLVQGRLPLELVMLSHADQDHVIGLVHLKRHLEVENPPPLDEPAVRIGQMWLNGFDDAAFPELTRSSVGVQSLANEIVASVTSVASTSPLDEVSRRDDELTAWISSTGECRELRDFARAQPEITINEQFEGGLVRRDSPKFPGPFRFNDDELVFTVLGPDEERIVNFRNKWKSDLEDILDAKETQTTAFEDKRKHNLASIQVMVERGRKRLLLTGDGRADHLVEGLKAQQFLDADGRVHVDVFKVPHHGSSRNVEQSTFETVVADDYVISANGEHDNPDIEMLNMLKAARNVVEPGREYRVHLTFPDRAFEEISLAEADQKPGKAKQRKALKAVNDWLRDDRPPNFVPVFRDKDELSVTVDLLK